MQTASSYICALLVFECIIEFLLLLVIVTKLLTTCYCIVGAGHKTRLDQITGRDKEVMLVALAKMQTDSYMYMAQLERELIWLSATYMYSACRLLV